MASAPQTRPSTQPSPFAKQSGTLLVKKISVAQDPTFGGPRYELGTNQAPPNDIIHLSPRMDREAYAQALALCPKIAEMTWNDLTKRTLTLVTFWNVTYKVEMRSKGTGINGVKAAKKIVATDKTTADTPAIQPDTVAAVATMEAYEASQRAIAETTTDELTAYLRGDDDDELTKPKETTVSNQSDDWGGFWSSVKNIAHDLDITDHHAYVHAFYEVDTVKDRNKTTMLKELKKHFDAVRDGKEELLPKVAYEAEAKQTPEQPKSDEKQNNAQKAPKLDESAPVGPDGQSSQGSGLPANIPSSEPPKPTVVDNPKSADTFEIDPFLTEAKTLMGIPALQIQEFVNRKYEPWAYGKTQAAFASGGQATVIDPIAVRQRFDRIFGPHGIGWRIIPAESGSGTFLTPFSQKTRNGERDMYQVTLSAYCMEYRIRIGDQIEWQRTSAFTDSNDNDDLGYAGGGAFSSLMKQALKMLGGYDHFIIPDKKRKAANAA